jgi:hypothetical protein
MICPPIWGDGNPAELVPRCPKPADSRFVRYSFPKFGRLGFSLDAARWYEELLRRDPNRTDRQDLLNRIAALRR